MSTQSPAEELRAAAQALRETAKAATPGPWERPLNTRRKDVVVADLPDGEQPRTWRTGYDLDGNREKVGVAQVGIWSNGAHVRKRSGRDLEWIALMSPDKALPLAAWLEAAADRMDEHLAVEGSASKAVHPRTILGLDAPRADWTAALAFARLILGRQP